MSCTADAASGEVSGPRIADASHRVHTVSEKVEAPHRAVILDSQANGATKPKLLRQDFIIQTISQHKKRNFHTKISLNELTCEYYIANCISTETLKSQQLNNFPTSPLAPFLANCQ